ncbi:MAG: hypothetical protein KJO12_05650, partial [Ignavibacteria bacterium]|nr:hypothetical protein [Ignavibacteria bacterium]
MEFDLLLVDCPHLMYRAAFVFNEMVCVRKGEEYRTGVVYGTLNMLRQVYERYGGKIICCYEDPYRSKRSFRRSLYEQYKRKSEDEVDYGIIELRKFVRDQEKVLKEVFKSIGVAQCWSPRFEADDCIATLCNKHKKDKKILIFSGDKDLFALIDDNVSILKPNLEKVEKKEPYSVIDLNAWNNGYKKFPKGHKVKPEQWSLALALSGDNADNVPGINKVGPINAEKIILNHGSTMEEIIKSATDKEVHRFSESICEMKEQLLINEKLTKLYDDVELNFNPPEQNRKKVRDMLRQMKMHQLLLGGPFNLVMEMGNEY